jgi:lipid-A-disaccharide synthase
VRVFFSTGEASGEVTAVELAQAMRALDPGLVFEGIGADRMRAAGFTTWHDTRGWASLGISEAIRRIPKLWTTMVRTAIRLRIDPPALVVLVDFGAANLRLAKTMRLLGYRGTIVYDFPPAAWLDRERAARAVAKYTRPLTPFEHQRDFYASLGIAADYIGHPLVSTVAPRAERPAPPADGGHVALLPGSRSHELAHHAPVLLAALAELRRTRPRLTATFVAANDDAERRLLAAAAGSSGLDVRRDARAVFADVDAAWTASGTVVLEAALREVPCVAFYIVSAAQERQARRFWNGPFVTLPNLVLGRGVVPELLQDAATPARLAAALDAILADPREQLAGYRDLRAALGPPDTLERTAAHVLGLARAGS